MRITCDHHGHAKASTSVSKKTDCKWVVHIEEMEEDGSKVSVVTNVKLDHNHTCKSAHSSQDPQQRFEKVQALGKTLAEAAQNSPDDYEVICSALERLEQVVKRQKTTRAPPLGAGDEGCGQNNGEAA